MWVANFTVRWLLWRFGFLFLTVLAQVFVGGMSGADAAVNEDKPFINFRQKSLDYAGPDAPLTNLTEVALAWFGPHDPTNSHDNGMWWAANKAIDEANSAGGVNGLKFRLIPCWSHDPWKAGVAQLARLVYASNILAIISAADSASAHLAAQVAAKANLPMVCPGATDKTLTLAGVSWVFTCAPSDDSIARVVVSNLLWQSNQNHANTPRPRRVVLLSAADHESRMTVRELSREFTRQNRQPDYRFDLPAGLSRLPDDITSNLQAHASSVLVAASENDAAAWVKTIRTVAPHTTLFGIHTLGRSEFFTRCGSSSEGIYVPLIWDTGKSGKNSAAFFDEFRNATTQMQPDYQVILTYDAVRMLVKATEHGGLSRSKIREALGHLSPWNGMGGIIDFDGTGHNRHSPIRMGMIRQARLVPLD